MFIGLREIVSSDSLIFLQFTTADIDGHNRLPSYIP